MNTQIIIVGAGPVGLLLANLLGQQGIDTVVIDRKASINSSSRAIGITPPSLSLLDGLGIVETFIENGVRVEGAAVHGKRSRLGSITFQGIPHPFKFILSIPQRQTEHLLVENLKQFESVRLVRNYEVTEYSVENEMSVVKAGSASDSREAAGELWVKGRYLCACDGFRSTLRGLSAIGWEGKMCSDTFLMADYVDRTALGSDAHLFFTPEGSVESFPLPGQKRRWVIQTDSYMDNPPEDYLSSHVNQRAGFMLPLEDKLSISSFRVYTYIMKRFDSDRVIFLGDAAHTISPIGGQGMNTGFADAGLAAFLLPYALREGDHSGLFNIYTRCRRRAAVSAAKRAILSMKTGTIRGRVLSGLRNVVIKIALHTPAAKVLPKHFAMLTIPFRDVESVKNGYGSILE